MGAKVDYTIKKGVMVGKKRGGNKLYPVDGHEVNVGGFVQTFMVERRDCINNGIQRQDPRFVLRKCPVCHV